MRKVFRSTVGVILTMAMIFTSFDVSVFAVQNEQYSNELQTDESIEVMSNADMGEELEVVTDSEATIIEPTETDEIKDGNDNTEVTAADDVTEADEIISNEDKEEVGTSEEPEKTELDAEELEALEDNELTGAGSVIHSGQERNLNYTITSDGTLTITGSGSWQDPNGWLYENDAPEWCNYASDIRKAVVRVKEFSTPFNFFYNCVNLETVDFSGTDTSVLQSTSRMFVNCSRLKKVDWSKFNTKNVRRMDNMFDGCSSIDSISFINGLDTSSVTNVSMMFANCTGLEWVDISRLNLQNVYLMSGMFYGCSNLEYFSAKGAYLPKVRAMRGMFNHCTSLQTADLRNIKTGNLKMMDCLFNDCVSLNDVKISGTDTSTVKSMAFMFCGCENFRNLGPLGMSTNSVDEIEGMFDNCYNLEKLDISNFDLRNLKQSEEIAPYRSIEEFDQYGNQMTDYLYCEAVDMWGGNAYVTNYDIFRGCSNLKEVGCPKRLPRYIEFELPSYDEPGDWKDNYSNVVTALPYVNDSLRVCKWTKPDYRNLIIENDDGKRIGSVDVLWADQFFRKNSSEYNHDVAKIAAAVSTIVYNGNYGTILKDLSALGFETHDATDEWSAENTKHYFKDDTNHKEDESETGLFSPLWITHRPIMLGDGRTGVLLLVAYRGTSGTEWLDNFEPGLGENHSGFDRAAWFGKDKINEYMKEYKLDTSNMYVLLTGHSRGAAAANLLGKKIDDEEVESLKGVNLNRVFVYTYATPNNTRMSNCHDSKYDNIINIINPEDFVTRVMPKEWGYKRNGRSFVFPSSTLYYRCESLTDEKYGRITTYEDYKWRVKALYKTYNKDAEYEPYKSGVIEMDDYIRFITQKVRSVDEYYSKNIGYRSGDDYSEKTHVNYKIISLYRLFMQSLGRFMAKNDIWSITSAATGLFGKVGMRTFGFFAAHAIKLENHYFRPDFQRAHEPYSYLAMLNVISEEALLVEKKYYGAIISCPVDISVVDGDGNVVGQIINNEVISGEDSFGLEVQGESKQVYFPGDDEYTLRITGNDIGTMDYTVVTYSSEGEEINRVVYKDVPVEIDESYEETFENDKTITEMELVNPDGDVVDYDAEYSGDEIGDLSVEVVTEGIGEASGYGNLSPGDYVVLSATTNGINSFLGWYEEGSDEPISTETEYGISVMDNVKLIAKFTTNTEGMWAEKPYGIVYSGEDIKPDIDVYDGEELLEKNVDYTLTYKNTKNAYELTENDEGFDASKAPTIIVKGKGNYSGASVDVVYFTISRADISDESINITATDQKYSTGKEAKTKITVKRGKKSLKESTDYVLTYLDDTTQPGTVNVKVSGVGNYTGSREISYRIYNSEEDFKNCVIQKIDDCVYSGQPIEPYVYVSPYKNTGALLVPNEDYKIIYSNNTDVGTATVTVIGIGDYEGFGNSKTMNFKIIPKDVKSDDVIISVIDEPIYNGSILTPAITITDKDTGTEIAPSNYTVSYKNTTNAVLGSAGKSAPTISISFKKNYKGSVVKNFDIAPLTLTEEDLSVVVPDIKFSGKAITEKEVNPVLKYGKKTLSKGKDYDVAVANKPGVPNTMTATIVLKGNYLGTFVKDFKVYRDVVKAENFIVTVSDETLVYDGTKKMPAVTVEVMDGEDRITLTENKDYKLAYSDNIKAASKTDKKAPAVKVTGMGGYSGSTQKYPFTIERKTVTEEDLIFAVNDALCSGKGVTPKVSIIDKKTGKAVPSSEYTVSYANNIKASEKGLIDSPYVIITGKQNYNFDIDKELREFRIYNADIAKMTFGKIESVSYNQKQHKPVINVYSDKNMTNKLTESTDGVSGDYIVTYGDNRRAGKGTVTVKGINGYGGTKTVEFIILPKWLSWLIH